MSTKKKGILTLSKEWAKHLRKYGKRVFWSAERKAAQRYLTSADTLKNRYDDESISR